MFPFTPWEISEAARDMGAKPTWDPMCIQAQVLSTLTENCFAFLEFFKGKTYVGVSNRYLIYTRCSAVADDGSIIACARSVEPEQLPSSCDLKTCVALLFPRALPLILCPPAAYQSSRTRLYGPLSCSGAWCSSRSPTLQTAGACPHLTSISWHPVTLLSSVSCSPRTLVSYVASVDLGGSIPQMFVDQVQKTQPLIIGKLRDQMVAKRRAKQ